MAYFAPLAGAFFMIAKTLKQRGIDDWGDGSFGAPRGDRTHKGIDYAADPGDEILAPIPGAVTKLGYPYAPRPSDRITYRYVEITDYSGRRHRVFYIEPTVNIEQHVNLGTIIGISQDIAGKYHRDDRNSMINHCHYEILDLEGKPVKPGV